MSEPTLYERYDRHEAIAVFGSEASVLNLCDGQWVLFPEVVLCFAEVGEPPRTSHLTSGGEFCWVAEQPYRVNADENLCFVPEQAVASHADHPIRLFVRPQRSGGYLYAGELEPACRFTLSGLGNHGEAYFRLMPALPSEVWAEIGGLQPVDIDHTTVDAALDRLRRPGNVEDRLWVFRQLVAYFHGAIGPEDGFSDEELAGLAIPYPLRWWYRWAGRRKKILSGQNFLLNPDQLVVQDDLLVFYGENQWCYEWATLFKGDDPPVFGRTDPTDPWEREGIKLSEHLILACLFEGIAGRCPYGAAAAWLDEDHLCKIVEHVPPISIPPWCWADETRLYARGGAFMYSMRNCVIDGEQGYSVWIGAKTEHPLQFLKDIIDDGWEYVAV